MFLFSSSTGALCNNRTIIRHAEIMSFEFFLSLGAASLRGEENVSADRHGDSIADNASNGRQLLNRILSTQAVGQRAEKLCHRAQTSLQLDRPNANCIIRLLADFEYLFNFIQLYDRAKKSSGQQPSEAKNHSISWRNVCRLCWFGFWSFAIFFLPFSKSLLFSFLTTTTAVRRARRNENFTYSIVEGSVLQQL